MQIYWWQSKGNITVKNVNFKDRWQPNKGNIIGRVGGVVVIEINGVRSEGAIRVGEGSRELVLVCPSSLEPIRRLCLIRPVNLRDWGHPGTLIRPDGSTVPRQMSAIFTLFIHLLKHTHIITPLTHPPSSSLAPNASSPALLAHVPFGTQIYTYLDVTHMKTPSHTYTYTCRHWLGLYLEAFADTLYTSNRWARARDLQERWARNW